MKILLVDDNREIRRTLTKLLQGAGHQVEACLNGQDAWSKLENMGRSVELVVTDVQMPTMGGVEFATRLRAHGSLTPIIFMMGGLDAELTDARPQLGPCAVVRKPFMMSTFLDAVSLVSEPALA